MVDSAPGDENRQDRAAATHARYRAVNERYLRARQRYMDAMGTSWQLRVVNDQWRHVLGSDPEAMLDRAMGARLTLMSLRPRVEGDIAALVDTAVERCDEIEALLRELARRRYTYTYLWRDDVDEIDRATSAIYQLVAAGPDPPA